MSAASPWSQRNILSIVGIIVVAAIVVVITAIATSGSSSEAAVKEQEPLPDFAGILLDEGAVSSLMDGRAVTMTNHFNGLYAPFAEPIDPVECNAIGSFADSYDYVGAPWRFARTQVFEESTGENLWVGETAVLFGSAEDAQAFFDKIKSDWDACDGQVYQFNEGEDRWVAQDYSASSDLLVNNSVVEGSTDTWKCQRAFGFRDVYVAEAQVCNNSDGQAQQIVEDILAAAES